MRDATLGVSTCGLALLVALRLSPYTWWGTCDGEGKRVLFPWACEEDAILSSSVPCRQTFCIPESLSAACPVPFASSSCPKGDMPMAAFAFRLSESVSFYIINLSLYRPKGFFLKQIWMFYSFLSSDQGIKHVGIFGLFFVRVFFHIVNLIRISCFVLFYFGTEFFCLSYLSSGISFVFASTLKSPFQEIYSQCLRNLLQLGNPSWYISCQKHLTNKSPLLVGGIKNTDRQAQKFGVKISYLSYINFLALVQLSFWLALYLFWATWKPKCRYGIIKKNPHQDRHILYIVLPGLA